MYIQVIRLSHWLNLLNSERFIVVVDLNNTFLSQGSQTIVAMTRGADDLKNNYNGTVLFCEEANMEGEFLSAARIQVCNGQ